MLSALNRDLISGILLICVGIAIAAYAAAHYDIGTLSRMGPGYFPVALGVLLAGLGVLVSAPALVRGDQLHLVRMRPLVATGAGIAAFSLMIVQLGVAPAVVTLTVLSALADRRLSMLSIIGLSIGLAMAASVLFSVVLGLPFKIVVWPF